MSSNRILVTYCYSEKTEFSKNLFFFLKHANLTKSHDFYDIHYCVVIQGHECSVEFPKPQPKNLTILKRDNEGFDFGAYRYALDQFADIDFEYYMFLNCTARGPFVHHWMPQHWHWLDPYIQPLSNMNKKISLVGASMMFLSSQSIHPQHSIGSGVSVEGWAFAVDKQGLEILMTHNPSPFIQHQDKDSVVQYGEKLLGAIILNAGLDIHCLLEAYHDIDNWRDYQDFPEDRYPSRHTGYYGTPPNHYQTIFIKNIVKHYVEPSEGHDNIPQKVREREIENYTRWIELSPSARMQELKQEPVTECEIDPWTQMHNMQSNVLKTQQENELLSQAIIDVRKETDRTIRIYAYLFIAMCFIFSLVIMYLTM